MPLILASQSPRRQQLLKSAGFDFTIQTKNVPEDYPADMPLQEVPAYLAEKKALPFLAEINSSDWVISADTVVILGHEIIGKPTDLADAFRMLRKLSGQWHEVITGVCLLSQTKKNSFSESTMVKFKLLSEAEIEHYLKEFKPLDKAGSYGIQDWIGLIGVERIEGCFYNVMGLPVSKVYQALKDIVL
jgi:septum formation protein